MLLFHAYTFISVIQNLLRDIEWDECRVYLEELERFFSFLFEMLLITSTAPTITKPKHHNKRRRELLGGIAGELSGVEVMLEDRVFRDKPVDYLFGFLPGDFLRRREIGTDHLLDLRFIIRADVDNLDGTHNHRALEGKQEEEEKAYHIADGSECGVPIPAAYQEEKLGKANGSNQDTPDDAAERESEKFEQAPHKRIPPVVCQERLIP